MSFSQFSGQKPTVFDQRLNLKNILRQTSYYRHFNIISDNRLLTFKASLYIQRPASSADPVPVIEKGRLDNHVQRATGGRHSDAPTLLHRQQAGRWGVHFRHVYTPLFTRVHGIKRIHNVVQRSEIAASITNCVCILVKRTWALRKGKKQHAIIHLK